MLHIAQLLLIHRLLTLPAMSFMRRLAIARLIYHFYDNTGKHSGPLCESLKTCKMYEVDHFVKEMMYNLCSTSHDQWCKQVKEIVYQRERDMWIVRKGMYKKTLIFNYCITNIEMWCWWKVSSVNPLLGYMVRLVLRLISGEHILACNTARWTKETPICKLCDVYTTESVWHFLFDCINVNLGVVREEILKTIYDVMPTPMQI